MHGCTFVVIKVYKLYKFILHVYSTSYILPSVIHSDGTVFDSNRDMDAPFLTFLVSWCYMLVLLAAYINTFRSVSLTQTIMLS